jgi:hypothetical protein
MDNRPKISDIEAILLLIFVGFADFLEAALGLFLLPDLWIPDIITFPITQIYFRMKGVRGTYALAGNLLELIPYVSALPMRTGLILATIIIDRSPKIKAKLEKVGPKVIKPVTK